MSEMAKIAVITGRPRIGRRVRGIRGGRIPDGLADLRVPAETIGAVTERGAERLRWSEIFRRSDG